MSYLTMNNYKPYIEEIFSLFKAKNKESDKLEDLFARLMTVSTLVFLDSLNMYNHKINKKLLKKRPAQLFSDSSRSS